VLLRILRRLPVTALEVRGDAIRASLAALTVQAEADLLVLVADWGEVDTAHLLRTARLLLRALELEFGPERVRVVVDRLRAMSFEVDRPEGGTDAN
jgi:hypothetical protein